MIVLPSPARDRGHVHAFRSHLLAALGFELLEVPHGPAVAGRLRETILNERKIIDPARVLELFARPQKMVARPHRDPASDVRVDLDRNGRLRPRPFHLQLVLNALCEKAT